jgi:hypothetical protein
MASAPNFATIPVLANGNLSVANTNRDGTGTLVTVYTAPAGGAEVYRMRLKATGDPADSIITVFLHDGTVYHIFDDFDIGNPAAPSAVNPAVDLERRYEDLRLPEGWSVRAGITVAPTSGWIEFFLFGAEFGT